jgi:peptidyl-prolyl cis-trans isomerase B (cyclophilin B)
LLSFLVVFSGFTTFLFAKEKEIAVIKTDFGVIKFEFFEQDAPNHTANFKKLAQDKFYDGTTFHRVIPGFMIQGGDPNSKDEDRKNDGTGGPGYTIKAEFNSRPHLRGTVSMARARHPDSAGSQFFICVTSAPFLNRQYTVFGQVIEGMEVVDKIVNQPRDARDNPLEKVVMREVTIEPMKGKGKEKKNEKQK